MRRRRRILVPVALVAAGVAPPPAVAGEELRPAVASFYGPGLWGNPLACGGQLQTWTRGVAHKTLDCGTRVRVCSKRCRTARVIDRGPFVAGREFDLTMQFAGAVGLRGVGTVYVRVIERGRT